MKRVDFFPHARELFGLNLKRLRKNSGLTQVEFANRLGINQGALSQLESGVKGFTSESITEFSQKLSVHPWELLVEDLSTEKRQLLAVVPTLDDAVVSALLISLGVNPPAILADQVESAPRKRR